MLTPTRTMVVLDTVNSLGGNYSFVTLEVDTRCEAKPTTLKRPSPGDGLENHM